MKIAIVGSGNVGGALGTGWRRAGHTVSYVERGAAPPSDAEIVVLAIPGSAVESVVRGAQLEGKIVLDCTNGLPSSSEHIAAWAPQAYVVKIFNTTGFENMADPIFGDQAATMFYVGDDAGAKATASRLAADLGFDPVDAGPLANARFLDMLASFMVTLAYGQHMGRGIAFRLLRR